MNEIIVCVHNVFLMGGVYLKSMADSWISLMNFWELWSIISHDKHLYLTLLKSYSLILCSCLSVPTRHSLTHCKVFLAVFRSSKRALVEDVGEIQLSCTVLSLVQSFPITCIIRWYTSMLGKKTSLRAILDELKKHQVEAGGGLVGLGHVKRSHPEGR